MSVRSWPTRPLGELLRHVQDPVSVQPNQQYPNFGIYSFGRGVFAKPPINGSTSSATTLYRAKAGQFVYSRLFAFEGAYGLVPDGLDGCYVSNEFPLLEAQSERLRLRFLEWYFRLPTTWVDVATNATGMGSRRQRIHPEGVFSHEIPLPEPVEQDRIVAKLDAAAALIAEAQGLCREIDETANLLIVGLAHRADLAEADKLTAGWTRAKLADIAENVSEPIKVLPNREYPNLGIYSFGRGLFHKPPISGLETSATTLFRVRAGQFIYSRLFAFEGACGLVTEEFDGVYVSNEYPTFSVKPGALPEFLYAYFMSSHVWHSLAAESKGLGVRRQRVQPAALMNHELLVPPMSVQAQIREIFTRRPFFDRQRAEMQTEIKATMPAILDRAFKGEL
ncbi:MAG: restriction endonuclease subunit S [Planctomycetales bacterium]|nr:restriction endonuclease subunit S [Planctomycetales bacterium]